MEKIYSAYNVNEDGLLVYSGLPTKHDDLTYEDHNKGGKQWEILGIVGFESGKCSLGHGIGLATIFNMTVLEIRNCQRAFDK